MLNFGLLKKTKHKIIITILLSTYFILHKTLYSFHSSKESFRQTNLNVLSKDLTSSPGYHIDYSGVCECRQKESFKLYQTSQKDLFSVVGQSFEYKVSLKELNRTTCDLFNTLRRPRGQKIYSVNLYGKEGRYYQLFECN